MLQFLKCAALASFACLCLLAAVTIWQLRAVPAKVDALLDSTQKTVLLSNKAMNDARLTLDNVNKGAIDERLYFEKTLPQTVTRVNTILESANQTVLSLKNASDQVTASTKQLTDHTDAVLVTMDGLGHHTEPVLQDAATAISNVNALATDPAIINPIKASLANIDVGTQAAADSLKQADGILTDGRIVADKYVKPQKWYMRALGYVLKGGELTYDFVR